jgi:hypothetical protein
MAAIHQQQPGAHFEIFAQTPEWLFANSLSGPFDYHSLLTDIGLAQKTTLLEDIPTTFQRLQEFVPFDPAQVDRLAKHITQLNCRLAMCDIAPLGLAVAQAAGIPAVLIENFTWDWIYEGYLQNEPRLAEPITHLRQWFTTTDYHIQTEPVCRRHAQADLTTLPICRQIRTPAAQIRAKLALPDQSKVILLTMGGIPWRYTFLEKLNRQSNLFFIIPGVGERLEKQHNLILMPHHSDFYHPDLINAADVVIGKVGYSTLAEVYQAGIPFGYVARSKLRESPALTSYIENNMQGLPISETEFENGTWLSLLPDLLAMPRLACNGVNGADQVADFVFERVLNWRLESG